MKNNLRGFTLLEVMIVVAVVAILASIAYPSYQSYVLRSHRSDAIKGLLSAQLRQEEYRVKTGAYAGEGQESEIGLTDSDYYTFSVVSEATSSGAPTYTLSAEPKENSSQIADTECSKIEITSTDAKSPDECWK